MTHPLRNSLGILLLSVTCGPAIAQQDKPVLPKVLIVGDSVYYHARGVSGELKGRASIQFANWPKGVLPSSTNAIEHIDQLIGRLDRNGNPVPEDRRPTWDVIHFNVGLGDLIHCVPNIKSHRVLPYSASGVIRTDVERYEKNLDELIRLFRKKAPDAKIIWASTTPIRHSNTQVFKLGTEIEYNAIAARVMKKHNVPINDMYEYAKSVMNMDKPAGFGFDPFHFDKKPLHPPVVAAICKALGIAVPEPPVDTNK